MSANDKKPTDQDNLPPVPLPPTESNNDSTSDTSQGQPDSKIAQLKTKFMTWLQAGEVDADGNPLAEPVAWYHTKRFVYVVIATLVVVFLVVIFAGIATVNSRNPPEANTSSSAQTSDSDSSNDSDGDGEADDSTGDSEASSGDSNDSSSSDDSSSSSSSDSDPGGGAVASDAYKPSQARSDSSGRLGNYDGLLIDMGFPNGVSPSNPDQVAKFERELIDEVLVHYAYDPIDSEPHEDGLYVGCASDPNVHGGYDYTIKPLFDKGLFQITRWYDPGYGGYDLASHSWYTGFLPACEGGYVSGNDPVYEKDATLYNSDGSVARQGTTYTTPLY